MWSAGSTIRCLRDNVYVFIDEAHRSVAKDLGTYLMAAVPKATIIGFTSTPIARTAQGEGTFKIFGTQDELGYLDKYSIAESIADETTLPIKHVMAPSEMTVPAERLDKEFFALAESEGVTDVEELNKVLDRAVGLRTFLTADDRIEKVSAFIAEHFKENVLPLGYKAFVVAVNREACAKYKRALDKLLPPEWSAPVYTENSADVVDRPLVAELQLSDDAEEQPRQHEVVRGLRAAPEADGVFRPLRPHRGCRSRCVEVVSRQGQPELRLQARSRHPARQGHLVGGCRRLHRVCQSV